MVRSDAGQRAGDRPSRQSLSAALGAGGAILVLAMMLVQLSRREA